jgi:hypothetical protein
MSTRRLAARCTVASLTSLVPLAACTVGLASAPPSDHELTVDLADPVEGVPDRGDDPAVVAIDSGGPLPCAGVLIAPDVVLTARHCASVGGASFRCPEADSAPQPLHPPASLRVLVGETAATFAERARGREILVPAAAPCEADIALVLLDQGIDDILALSVRMTGAAEGDRVRTVGFDLPGAGDRGAIKVLRDHLAVSRTTLTTLEIGQGWCEACGGPALDEVAGEVLGVASRSGGPDGSTGSFNVYTRTDAFLDLVEQALSRSFVASGSVRGVTRQKAKKGPADLGSNCTRGADGAAGACVTDGASATARGPATRPTAAPLTSGARRAPRRKSSAWES